uniref:Polymorphic mucin variant C-r2/2; Polymorphic mucin variant IC-r2/2 n=1 Tax=Schistosoma mansoni TaxID=6183 RepID=A0A5K4F2M6_SCHMA
MQQLISLCCKVMKMNMKRPRREIKMLTAGETVIIIIILITANKFETASRSLVDLMGEAEFQRILLLTTLPKDEQINMIIQAMDKDSTNCSFPKHLKTRINDYKYAYYKSSIQKFLSLEPYTRARSTTAPHIYHEECLRLEKLYFTKWAVHYLSKNAATDITLLQSYENEYEEAKKGDKNADRRRDWSGLLRVRISEKWKKRELLDDVESAYIAETRTKVNVNKEKLKKQLTNTENKIEAQLNIVKELESKAIQATNEHMDNRDDKSLKEQYYEAYSTLAKELRSLVDLMGEAEFQRILLLTSML